MTRCDTRTFFSTSRPGVQSAPGGGPSRGRNHLNFTLDSHGVALRIYGPDVTLIDAVDTGTQQPGVLQGCLAASGRAGVSVPTNPAPRDQKSILPNDRGATPADRVSIFPALRAKAAAGLVGRRIPVMGTTPAGAPGVGFSVRFSLSPEAVSVFDRRSTVSKFHSHSGTARAFSSRGFGPRHNNLVVVDFDPVADPAALATFCARFGVETTTTSIFNGRTAECGPFLAAPWRSSRRVARFQP